MASPKIFSEMSLDERKDFVEQRQRHSLFKRSYLKSEERSVLVDLKEWLEEFGNLARCQGYTPIYTHYYIIGKNNTRRLKATSCLLLPTEGGINSKIMRGVAVVSPEDNPSKVLGRAAALGRALFKAEHLVNRPSVKKLYLQKDTLSNLINVVPENSPASAYQGLVSLTTNKSEEVNLDNLSALELYKIRRFYGEV